MKTASLVLSVLLFTACNGDKDIAPEASLEELPVQEPLPREKVVEQMVAGPSLIVQPVTGLERLLDQLMKPVMVILSGTLSEQPQQTHRWNNTKFSPEEVNHLAHESMVHCEKIRGARPAWLARIIKIPIFHMPIFGGWRDYVVIEPTDYDGWWHIGWTTQYTAGVSRIPIKGPVRMLLGDGDVSFFGVKHSKGGGEQIPIQQTGTGRIGSAGPHASIPLL